MKIFLIMVLGVLSLTAKTISLDKEDIIVNLKNNSVNILKFPFVINDATITSETAETFISSSKNNVVTITATSINPNSDKADLLIWSQEGNAHLLKLKTDGLNDQIFTMSSQKTNNLDNLKAARYETNKIESDIKNLMKTIIATGSIPGYKKVDVKKIFKTTDLDMQKELFYDGGKYRIESWFIQNTTDDTLFLDYENFYTSGVISIAFEKRTLNKGDITKAWFIINKNTIYENSKKVGM